ncbi:MAG: ribonuclease R [Burkholderiaceae bacterium]|jgi:ribonuclease R
MQKEFTQQQVTIPSREAILAALREANAPLTSEQLVDQLGIDAQQQEGFSRRLQAMERDGQLMPNRKGVLLLATKLDFVAGRVTGHRDGFGFLIRDDKQGGDIFLTPREMQKVLHGDRVLVRVTGTDNRGRPEGTIVEVTERRTNQLVGRLLCEHGVMIVVPEDQRIKHDILVPPGESGQAKAGQVVSVQIIEQPSRQTKPIGRVVEVLGDIGDAGMEIEIAVRKFDVPHEFSVAAEHEADELPDEVEWDDLQGRIDLRDVPLVTIDGEDARDFDDAVYCEPIYPANKRSKSAKPTGWRLLVAIADVSHYVATGAPLDQDALQRGTSVYFPRRVIPMLPEKLSNGLCSLKPEVDRLVLVCDAVITPAGAIKAYQFYNAVIHSAARLTYNEVWESLSDPESPAASKRAALLPQLHNLYALFKVLLDARHVRGAMDLDTVETMIVTDANGKIDKILPRRRNDAHRLIEECMLAANVCAADFLLRSKHAVLFRIHEGPTPDKLTNLRAFLKTLNLNLGGGEQPTAQDYGKLVAQIVGRPDKDLLQTMILRSMQQAVYSPHNVGHFGLAYEAYAHFTSPIRRYPDLLVHRTIKALLAGKTYLPPALDNGDDVVAAGVTDPPVDSRRLRRADLLARWEQLGLWLSSTERRADEASRDVEAWLKCFFMKEKVGDAFSGHVSGVAPFGIFVTLDTLFVEGLVHVSELGTEYFKYNETLHELRGERTGQRYRLTDPIHIQIARVDLEARRIEFRLVQGTTFKKTLAAKPPSPPKAKSRRRG